jgi:glycosyltransferase involved in cell wall biosynthesis
MSTTVRPMRHVYRTLLQDPRYIIVNNSRAGRQSDIAFAPTGRSEQHVVVYNGVEFAKPGKSGPNKRLRAKLSIPTDAPVLGGVFRLAAVKRPQLWLAVARAVLRQRPDAHFIIAGSGPMLDEVRADAESDGLAARLHLPGEVGDVGAWFRAMDATLLTSDREGMPNVVIESQFFGVPAVSSDVGGAAEAMIPGETGAVVPPGASPDTFADAAMPFLTDRAHSRAAGAKGAAFVRERFSVAALADRLIEVIGLREP